MSLGTYFSINGPHNPEVVGSSPVAATIKPLISHELAVFLVKKLWIFFSDAYECLPMLI